MNFWINELPVVPRSAPISCRSCHFPCRFRAPCAAFRAGFVSLVPLSTSVSCRLCHSCSVPRQFLAARAVFHVGFMPVVPLVPDSTPISCRSCRFPHRFRAAYAVRAAQAALFCRSRCASMPLALRFDFFRAACFRFITLAILNSKCIGVKRRCPPIAVAEGVQKAYQFASNQEAHSQVIVE